MLSKERLNELRDQDDWDDDDCTAIFNTVVELQKQKEQWGIDPTVAIEQEKSSRFCGLLTSIVIMSLALIVASTIIACVWINSYSYELWARDHGF